MVKKLLLVVLAIALIGGIIGYMQWNKPHKKVEDAGGLAISATDLTKAFAAGDSQANATYLNKALDVSGTVAEVETNQDGGKMVVLQSADPMTGVECTMRDKNVTITKEQQVTIKGFCSGNSITGVTLTDCILK